MDILDRDHEPHHTDHKPVSIAMAVGSDLTTMMSQPTIAELEQTFRPVNIISSYLMQIITHIHGQTHIKKIYQAMEPSTIHKPISQKEKSWECRA